MPGETVLPIQEAPDTFQYVNYSLYGSSIGGADTLIFHCEKDTIVDAAHINLGTVSTGAATITLYHALSGTVVGSGTAMTDAVDVNTGVTAWVPKAFTMIETANFVPAGSSIGIVTSASVTAILGTLTLRIRELIR